MAGRLRRIFGGSPERLEISQALGAFARPGEGDISPLHVFFEVANVGDEAVEITTLFVAPKGSSRPVHEGPFGGDGPLPLVLPPGGSARFHTHARSLAQDLREAGHGGRPKVRLVVEDASEERFEKAFRFRVDEYLRLKDE
jgi:hypothetical protein